MKKPDMECVRRIALALQNEFKISHLDVIEFLSKQDLIDNEEKSHGVMVEDDIKMSCMNCNVKSCPWYQVGVLGGYCGNWQPKK